MLIRNPLKFFKVTRPNGDLPEIAEYQQRLIDYCEQPAPRCDITGQPLTTRERFDRECG